MKLIVYTIVYIQINKSIYKTESTKCISHEVWFKVMPTLSVHIPTSHVFSGLH